MKSSVYYPDTEFFRQMKSEEYALEDDSQGEENEAHLKRKTGHRPDTSDMHGNNSRKEEEDDEDEKDEADKEDEQEESHRKVTHGFDLVEGKMDHGMKDFIIEIKREHYVHRMTYSSHARFN